MLRSRLPMALLIIAACAAPDSDSETPATASTMPGVALARMDHEIYGTFASLDGSISTEQVEGFKVALRAAGIENDIHIYDDVNHGFWLRIDQDVEARGEAGLDAWKRLKAYLERTLR